MSQSLHDDDNYENYDTKAIAIPQVFSENSPVKTSKFHYITKFSNCFVNPIFVILQHATCEKYWHRRRNYLRDTFKLKKFQNLYFVFEYWFRDIKG